MFFQTLARNFPYHRGLGIGSQRQLSAWVESHPMSLKENARDTNNFVYSTCGILGEPTKLPVHQEDAGSRCYSEYSLIYIYMFIRQI